MISGSLNNKDRTLKFSTIKGKWKTITTKFTRILGTQQSVGREKFKMTMAYFKKISGRSQQNNEMMNLNVLET
jgi:hypothetical protein